MESDQLPAAPCVIPAGFVAMPLEAEQPGVALRLCLLVRSEPDTARGPLVVLHESLDARVLLGCVIDRGQYVHEWIELWLQNPPRRAELPADADARTNSGMDRRWKLLCDALERCAPGALIRTGWEASAMPSTFVDVTKLAVRAIVTSKRTWKLCRDDSVLQVAGLPAYGGSAYRYLHAPDDNGQPMFTAASADAPTVSGVRTLQQAIADIPGLVPLNPTAGMMVVRKHLPLSLERYLAMLSCGHVEPPAKLVSRHSNRSHVSSIVSDLTSGGWLFLGVHGQAARLLESMHLRIRALAQSVSMVCEAVTAAKRPLLSLDVGSFGVRPCHSGAGVPALWGARVELTDPDLSIELQLPGSDVKYFVPRKQAEASVYRPGGLNATKGRAALRIRQTLPAASGAIIVEGTLATQQRLVLASQDLLLLKLPLASGSVDLYARLESEKSLAAGEMRFRTVATRFADSVTAELKAAHGIPFESAPFEQLPYLSTPADLYALGVLGVQALLVNRATQLSVAIDELTSLARQVGQSNERSLSLSQRIARTMADDPRLLDKLGPHRLTDDLIEPAQAMNMIPVEVWWELLACIIRMFPGFGADSVCRDLGDARADAPQKVFFPVIEQLERLLLRTRSLILIDWNRNREIHSVIRGFLAEMPSHESADDEPDSRPEPGVARASV